MAFSSSERRLLLETINDMLAEDFSSSPMPGVGLPVYSYLWNVIVNGLPAPIYGATHFQDVAFVFDNIEGIGYAANPFANEPQSHLELADLMRKMWVHFIHYTSPNLETATIAWPKYKPGLHNTLVFDTDYEYLGYIAKDKYRKEAISYLQDHVFV
ncbi:hypothetical protein Asppvi_001745 [Aspergillus pseudoviridinutans]|uniref:Carboxylesterase type B domain-containing protein n=1 Tax=Aspergillus pseudoviridinutans TaxID=1517512 RepID=A0A9P3B3X8_9EURO|nr:uncharacterized protein Asppvi_001745 [Aspergillus pseudoviridinutans]GIJ83225.1 hypothetical protein Asppvi_001745 [Aspergillus pseudoviridinutans]